MTTSSGWQRPSPPYPYRTDGATPYSKEVRRSVHMRATDVLPQPATEVVPQPVAVDGVVFNDVATRTLTVRLSDHASGYERLLWQQGWQQLRRSEEAGWPSNGAPWVWASTPGHYQVAHGTPVEGGQLSFHFPPGKPAYSELISKPGLVAIATVDRNTHRILSCKFLNRQAG